MIRRFAYIAATLASALVLAVSCGKDEAEVIPRDTLAQIYAEMLLTDQWILDTPNVKLIADTSLVYEPILGKYGFDAADYRKSVDHYMDDPERFAKIFRETNDILNARLDELTLLKEEQDRLKKLRKEAEKFRPDINFEEYFPYASGKQIPQYYDSVAFVKDTMHVYRFVHVERKDTIFKGPEIIVPEPDTVKVEKPDTVKHVKLDSIIKLKAPKRDRVVSPKFLKLQDGNK